LGPSPVLGVLVCEPGHAPVFMVRFLPHSKLRSGFFSVKLGALASFSGAVKILVCGLWFPVPILPPGLCWIFLFRSIFTIPAARARPGVCFPASLLLPRVRPSLLLPCFDFVANKVSFFGAAGQRRSLAQDLCLAWHLVFGSVHACSSSVFDCSYRAQFLVAAQL
jgi:hypothetical protein